MKLNILIGGKAGQGPNVITHMLAEALVKHGWHVFYSREYESVIRGGHNYNQITLSDQPVSSNESKIDILVALDDKTLGIHKNNLNKKSIMLKCKQDNNMYFLGNLFKILGLDFKVLENELKALKNFDENIKEARKGFNEEKERFKLGKISNKPALSNGSQGIAEGAIKSGLDVYYAYPMTPATPLLFELAGLQNKHNFLCLELENEIACINAAIGSSITGAKSMTGTSGGGFDLMTEALSEAGQAEVPLVVYLASRPGPSTGLATRTGQGDLQLARYCGHGEFFRLVIAPGDPIESQELTSQAFYFSQKYKIPAIILSDKHLAESFYSSSEKVVITSSEKSTELIRYNSYEHTRIGEATEDANIVRKNVERRQEKVKEIEKEARKFSQFKVYGKKNAGNVILSWGSTKGAILDAMPDDCKFIQVLYINPFPDLKQELEGKNVIVVENNATSPLSDLIAEKCLIRINDKNKILRYDGRPFFSDELKKEIEGRI